MSELVTITKPQRVSPALVFFFWRAEKAAAWILHSLIQWSLAVVHATSQTSCVCQTAANLLHALTETDQNRSQASLYRRHIFFTCGAELSLRVWDTPERIACGVIFVLCVISAFLRFHPGNMATPAAVNPSGEYWIYSFASESTACDVQTQTERRVFPSIFCCRDKQRKRVAFKRTRAPPPLPSPRTTNNSDVSDSNATLYRLEFQNRTLILPWRSTVANVLWRRKEMCLVWLLSGSAAACC